MVSDIICELLLGNSAKFPKTWKKLNTPSLNGCIKEKDELKCSPFVDQLRQSFLHVVYLTYTGKEYKHTAPLRNSQTTFFFGSAV